MKYTIVFARTVPKEMKRLPNIVQERVKHVLMQLSHDPFPEGAKTLHGYEHLYRFRVGDYRIIYDVKKVVRILTVIRVAHRKDVYRKMR